MENYPEDKAAACIRCAVTVVAHSLRTREKALGADVAARLEPSDASVAGYVNGIVRAATHGRYGSLDEWVDSAGSSKEADEVRFIWESAFEGIGQDLGALADVFDGTERHAEAVEKVGKASGAYHGVDAYFAGVPAGDVVA